MEAVGRHRRDLPPIMIRFSGVYGEAERHPEPFAQDRLERGVLLDRRDARTGGEQRRGEDAEAGADLEHARPRADAGRLDDAREDVAVDEEVLPERLAGTDAARAKKLRHRARGAEVDVRRGDRRRGRLWRFVAHGADDTRTPVAPARALASASPERAPPEPHSLARGEALWYSGEATTPIRP